MMSGIPGLTVTDEAALRAWLLSDAHLHHCIGYSEGQFCCLDQLVPDKEQETSCHCGLFVDPQEHLDGSRHCRACYPDCTEVHVTWSVE